MLTWMAKSHLNSSMPSHFLEEPDPIHIPRSVGSYDIYTNDDIDDKKSTDYGAILGSIMSNSSVGNITGSPVPAELNWGILTLFVLIVATAIGNVLVCLAVCWDRRLQNMTNYFLMSLAIADLLVALLVMPLGLIVELYGFFPLAPGICVIWASTDVLMCTASIWHMCTMSMDRYFTLKYPMKYGRNKTKTMVALKITFVWVISIAISSPICIMGFIDYSHIYNDNQCAPAIPNFLIYGSISAFYVPLFIMVVTYTLTTRILKNNQKLMNSLMQQKVKLHQQNGNLPNSSCISNGGDRLSVTQSQTHLRVIPSVETSISQHASIQESEDYLEKDRQSDGMNADQRKSSISSTQPAVTISEDTTAQSPEDTVNDPNIKYLENNESQFQLEASFNVKEFQNNGRFLDSALKKPTLSVSQPHLPSMGRSLSDKRRKHLSPSASHHSLRMPPRTNSQLSVSHLESVQNFDSILSLNSMLSNNWGSEAWSEFDDPAMFEKLSQIESEMDDCLTLDEISKNQNCRINHKDSRPKSFHDKFSSETSGDSPKSFIDSPSLYINESPAYNQSSSANSTNSSKRIFRYPGGSNFNSPIVEREKMINSGSSASLSMSYQTFTSNSAVASLCTSPTSPLLSPVLDTIDSPRSMAEIMSPCELLHNRPNSPAIMIEDMSYLTNENNALKPALNESHAQYINKDSAFGSMDNENDAIQHGLSLNDDTQSLMNENETDENVRSNCNSGNLTLSLSNNNPLQVSPSVHVAPIITTSPASSRSLNSPGCVESPARSGSQDSMNSGYVTLELKPKGCYMYKMSPPCVGSPWKLNNSKIDTHTCEDYTDNSLSSHCGKGSEENSDPWLLQPGNKQSLNDRAVHDKSVGKQYMQYLSTSQPEADLISQEVERSTDDTLSDPQSCSTSSAGRYHIPSLSVRWTSKKIENTTAHWKTFLQQCSFRRKGKTGQHSKQHISKRTATNERKASKVLGIIFAVFVILWTPFFLMNIITGLCVSCLRVITPPVMVSMVWLGYMSSLANPIIYTMFNTSFRRAFYNIVTCRLRSRYTGHNSSHSTKRHRTNTLYFSSSDRKKTIVKR